MAKVYERIEPRLARWIGEQPVFFVGTAPRSGDGLVNVSPEGHAIDGLPGPAGLPEW